RTQHEVAEQQTEKVQRAQHRRPELTRLEVHHALDATPDHRQPRRTPTAQSNPVEAASYLEHPLVIIKGSYGPGLTRLLNDTTKGDFNTLGMRTARGDGVPGRWRPGSDPSGHALLRRALQIKAPTQRGRDRRVRHLKPRGVELAHVPADPTGHKAQQLRVPRNLRMDRARRARREHHGFLRDRELLA